MQNFLFNRIAQTALVLFAAFALTSAEDDSYVKTEILYQSTFDTDLSDWILEPSPKNDHQAEIVDGTLLLATKGGQTCWLDRRFDGNIAVEYHVTVPSEGYPHTRVSDINQYFMAVDPDSPEAESPTPTTKYSGPDYYKKFRMYYCGMGVYNNQYTGFRRCDGNGEYPLVEECSRPACLIPADTVCFVECIRFSDRVTFKLNDSVVIDYRDQQAFELGFFGFRNYKSAKLIHDITVYRLDSLATNASPRKIDTRLQRRRGNMQSATVHDLRGRKMSRNMPAAQLMLYRGQECIPWYRKVIE